METIEDKAENPDKLRFGAGGRIPLTGGPDVLGSPDPISSFYKCISNAAKKVYNYFCKKSK